MSRTYEVMYIVRPDVEEADLDKLIEGFSGNITNGGIGEIRYEASHGVGPIHRVRIGEHDDLAGGAIQQREAARGRE